MAVPKLRFKEFTDEWRGGKIKDFGYFYYGKSAPKWSVKEDAKTPCIRYGELYTTHKEEVEKIKSYTTIPVSDLKFGKGGEVLVPRVGEDPLDFIKCTYLPFSDIAIGEMISVYNTTELPLFIVYYFRATMRKKFARVVEGGNVSNLYYAYLEDIKIYIPSYNEQEKIINMLKLLDRKIALQEKKIALLKDYKRGVFEKVFNSLKHYDSYKIEECFSHIGGTALEKYVQNNSEYNFISIGNYSIDGLYVDNGQRIELNKITATKLLDKHNLVMVLNDKTAKGDIIGSTILIDEYNKYIYNQRSERLICSKIINPNFAWYILNSKFVKAKIIRQAQGGTQIYVNFSMVGNIQIKLPPIETQIEISKTLSKVDKKLTLELNKFKFMQTIKQALLQQMFV